MSRCPCLNGLLLYVNVGLYYLFIITLLCQNAPVSMCYCYMFMVGFIAYLLLLLLYYVKMPLSLHITVICSWWVLLFIYYYYCCFIMSKCPCLNILLLYVHGGLYYLFIIICIVCFIYVCITLHNLADYKF